MSVCVREKERVCVAPAGGAIMVGGHVQDEKNFFQKKNCEQFRNAS